MKRFEIKLLLSFVIHVNWCIAMAYVCADGWCFTNPMLDYVNSTMIGNCIANFIFGEITIIMLILVYVIKPLEEKEHKRKYWSVSLMFTIGMLLFWNLSTTIILCMEI